MNSTNHDLPGTTRFDRLTPELMLQINRWCDAFEQSWSGPQPASLTGFLESLPLEHRESILPELVVIDIEFKFQKKMRVDVADYASLFPKLDIDWLRRQIQQARDNRNLEAVEAIPISTQIGDYDIQEELGAGGMGRVYKGVHRLMGRVVAVKVLRASIRNHPTARLRFEREVRAAAQLTHPNIVTAYDAREDNGVLYLVSEFVDGTDLAKLIREKGPLRPRHAVSHILQAAQGLRYAHEQGMVHRDIKPSNLLIDKKGVVKLLDLGLARWKPGSDSTYEESLTHSDQILGTAHYMSPEQARSALSADVRSDIYSLGCTLFFLLTGKPPFQGNNQIETILAHTNSPVPRLADSTIAHAVPPKLDQLLTRMMAKSPEERPESVRTVVAELRQLHEELQQSSKARREAPMLLQPSIDPAPPFDFLGLPLDPINSTAIRKLVVRRAARFHLNWFLWLGAALTVVLLTLMVAISFWPEQQEVPPAVQGKSSATKTRANPPVVPSKSPDPKTRSSGLNFNGRDSYLDVVDFDVAIDGPVMIEASVSANRQNGPANIVSWGGAQTLVLFRDSTNHWGIAHHDGTIPRLRISKQQIEFSRKSTVAGAWDGQQLRLYVGGREIESEPLQYELSSSRTSLFFGGIPPGILPPSQGTRFFSGTVYAVRLSRYPLPAVATTVGQLETASQSTVALFTFPENAGTETRDQSTHRWTGRLINATWGN